MGEPERPVLDKLAPRLMPGGRLAHPPGWDDLLEQLDAQLSELVPSYRIWETVLRYGSLRVDVDLPETSDDLHRQAFDLVSLAQRASTWTCQVCGQSSPRTVAAVMVDLLPGAEAWQVLCKDHQAALVSR